MRKENLEKHGVEYDSNFAGITFKESMLCINYKSCALCRNYNSCGECPLSDCKDEYHNFLDTLNPEPMISLIQRTIDKGLEGK